MPQQTLPNLRNREARVNWISKFRGWILAALLLGLWLWLCGPMITGSVVCGFRDSAFWYYPMFEWIDSQWAAGEVPLWNPFCNFGVPLVADGSSSVLYPGKLVFCFRFLSFPARYGLYLAGHILLAGAGTFWFSRILKANLAGASLAAISYAIGGTVLFQVANVIYLVGAAWLPVALGCVWLMIKTGRWQWAVAAGVVCALMILGGDPQMVYHVGLIAAATGPSCLWRSRRRQKVSANQVNSIKAGYDLRFFLGSLAILVATTIVLSLVQLWPSIEWSQLSERTSPTTAVNVYSAIGKDVNQSAASLFGPPQPGTIMHHAYQFSLPPWSLTELFWPNVSGKIHPVHQRWTDGLRGVDRIWIPSLYAGFLTLWLAITGMKFIGRSRRAWLTRVGLFFCVASFGWYGIGWWVNEVLRIESQSQIVGPQVGGLYWAMSLLLPKYYSFRYPAKLIVVAMLCLCVLAGVNLRRWRLDFSRTWMVFFALVSIVGIASLMLGLHNSFFDKVPDDGLYGPFDDSGATRQLIFSFVHSLVVLGTALIVFCLANRTDRLSMAVWSVVLITSFDLVIANRWLLTELPSKTFTESIDSLELLDRQLAARAAAHPGNSPPTIYRPGGAAFIPHQWRLDTSPNRHQEIVQWQRRTLFLQFHLRHRVRLIGSASSIWPEQYQRLLEHIEHEKALLKELCDGEIVSKIIDRESSRRIGHQAKQVRTETGEVAIDWYPTQQPIVFVMDDRASIPKQEKAQPRRGFPQPSELGSCELTNFGINEVRAIIESDNHSHAPWVVMNQLHDGNWIAKIKNLKTGTQHTEPLVELTDCFQGVQIEPGQYEITFQYYPIKFWIGAWLSGIGWLGLAIGWGFLTLRSRRNKKSPSAIP